MQLINLKSEEGTNNDYIKFICFYLCAKLPNDLTRHFARQIMIPCRYFSDSVLTTQIRHFSEDRNIEILKYSPLFLHTCSTLPLIPTLTFTSLGLP